MKKLAPLVASVLLVAAILTAALHSGGMPVEKNAGARKSDAPAEKMTLAYVNTTHAVLAGVALQQGYFEQEGLDVSPREHSFGKSALDDMLQGNADFATVADPPIMMAVMKGRDISVVATIQTSNKDNAIVAIKNAGIIEPSDLRGARIGATLETTSDFFMDAFLVGHAIGRRDVRKVNLKPEQLYDALMNGRVDAVSAFQPFLAKMQRRLGDRAVFFYDENIYTWTFSLVARQDYIRKHPETVEKVLRALLKAEAFVKQNSPEAQQIVADYSGMDIDLVRDIWSNMRFAVILDQFLVLALEDESRWAINSGMVDNRVIPNYLDYFYFEGLESVRPEAVRILGRNSARQ